MACPSWIHPNPTWPDVVDSTTGRDGTRFDRAFFLSVQQYIDQMSGTFYGLPSPANIAEEMAAARGDKDCLDDRLDGSIDEEGNLKLPENVATTEDLQSISGRNYILNDTLVVNPGGEAAAPYPWQADNPVTWAISYNAGQTIGTVNVTAGGTTTKIWVEIIGNADIASVFNALRNAPGFTFGCEVVATLAAQARLFIEDGATIAYGPYHQGGGSQEWLNVPQPFPLTAASQYLRVGIEIVGGGNIDFQLPMSTIAPAAPSHWRPTPYREVLVPFNTVGTALDNFVGAATPTYIFPAPGTGVCEAIFTGAAEVVAAGDTITWTLHRWDGTAWQVVTSITLAETEQFSSSAVVPGTHELITAVAPHIDQTERGRMFAYSLAVTGTSPWAEAAYVSTRWRVWDTPAGALYQAP